MEREKVVFVQCDFHRAASPAQRVFVIRFPGVKETLRGIASSQFCYTVDRKPIGVKPNEGEQIGGLLLGIELGRTKGGAVRVELPDSEVYELSEQHVVPVRSGSDEHVPVES